MAMNYRIYVDTGSGGFTELPVPSKMSYGLQDISAANAGRTESTQMMKNRIGRAPKISLTYNNQDTQHVTAALALCNSEYFNILYMDLEAGGVYTYGEFYRGDVSMEVYSGGMDIWSSCKFALIKRSGKDGVPCLSHQSINLPTSSSTAAIDVSGLGAISTVTSIARQGSVGCSVNPNDPDEYIITRTGGTTEGTVIFKGTNNKTIIVEVSGE